MLDETLLRRFEENFLEIGKELEILKSRKQKFRSVYDEEDPDAAKKSALSNIFGSVFKEEDLDQSLLEEDGEDISSDILAPIQEEIETTSVTEVFPDETPIVDESQATSPQVQIADPPSSSSDLNVASQPATKSTEIDKDIIAKSSVAALKGMFAQKGRETPEEVVVIEEVIEDDIDEIEETLNGQEPPEVALDITELILPAKYLQNPEFTLQTQEQVEKETPGANTQEAGDEDTDINDLLGDAEALLLEDADITEEIEYSEQDIEQMYSSGDALEKQPDKYRTSRDFHKEDEAKFFEKLDLYSIYIQGPIIEILVNDELVDDSERLVDLIFEQAAPTVIQREIEKLLQRNIRILDDNTIYGVEELQAKLLTVTQRVRKTSRIFVFRVLPIAAVIAFAVFYGYFFVNKPIRAWRLYEQGYAYLEEQNIEKSEQSFLRAASIWVMPKYYFKYADLYYDQRLFTEQKIKYEQLIFGANEDIRMVVYELFTENSLLTPIQVEGEQLVPFDIVNFSRKAFNAIVEYETTINKDFDTARLYYNVWLNKYKSDVAMQADFANFYIDWYDISKRIVHLDLARAVYDKTAVLSNQDETSALLRTRWAIRANDMDYFNLVFSSITSVENKITVTEETLRAYIEIVQKKLDMGETEHLAEILDIVEEQFPQNIYLPYLHAQYYKHINQRELLAAALDRSIYRYSIQQKLNAQALHNYVDSYILLADLHLEYGQNLISAKEHIKNAQVLFENNIDKHSKEDLSYLSRLYFVRSQIELLQGDIQAASEFIEKNEYFDIRVPQIEYHIALLHYLNKDWNAAANSFVMLMQNYSSRNAVFKLSDIQQEILMLATANAMFFNKNYIVASVFYENLLEKLNTNGNREVNFVAININSDTELINFKSKIAQIQNNLGASLYYVSKKSINPEQLTSQAFGELQESSALLQNLARDENYIRKSYRELSSINTETLISPKESLTVNIYSDLPYTMDEKKYWKVVQTAVNPTESEVVIQ